MPRFKDTPVRGCPSAAGLDGAVFPRCIGASVAPTHPPPNTHTSLHPLFFFSRFCSWQQHFWARGLSPLCPHFPPSPPQVTRGQRAQPGRLPCTGVHGGDTHCVPRGRSSPPPPQGHSPCPTGDEGTRVGAGWWHPSGGHSTPGTATGGAPGDLGDSTGYVPNARPHATARPPWRPPESPAPEDTLHSQPKNTPASSSLPPAKDITDRVAPQLPESPGMGTMPLGTGTCRGPGSWGDPTGMGTGQPGCPCARLRHCHPPRPGHGTVSLGASGVRRPPRCLLITNEPGSPRSWDYGTARGGVARGARWHWGGTRDRVSKGWH